MPEPDIVRVVREHKRALAERDAAVIAEMVRRWRQVEVATQRQLDKILAEIARRIEAGEIVTREMIYQMERYQQMLAQVRSEVAEYQDYAEDTIERVQRDAIDRGIADAIEAIKASGSPLAASFARMNPEAMRTIVGLCEDGSPLFDVLERRALYPESVQGLTDALVEGVTLGWNPRKTANSMMDGLADGLTKALVIARTEQMRAYRMASVAQYRASGVVSKFKRLSAKTDRTCLACLMADGEVLELEEELYDHPNGLCAAVPWVMGMPEPEWETGKDWFEGLDEDRQREMMGDAKYDAWKDGQFTLDQLVKTTDNPTWGKSLGVTPLSELVSGAGAKVDEFAASLAQEPDWGETFDYVPRELAQEELDLSAQVDDARMAYEDAVRRAGIDGDESRAIKEYLDALDQELSSTQQMNDALWRITGKTPEQATAEDWESVANALQKESLELYKKYTKEGIDLEVQGRRSAQDAGYACVGGEVVQVRRGRFSLASAQKLEAQLWREAKDKLTESYGEYLERLGFTRAEIARASYEQRQALLNELEDKALDLTARGTPKKIDDVPADARARVADAIGYDDAATCAQAAQDPLNLPSLDAYAKRELADRILSTKLSGPAPEWQDGNIGEWGV